MEYHHYLARFFEDLLDTSDSSGFKKFFYRSRSTVLITLFIASGRPGAHHSLEDILQTIPNRIVSRTTIKNILDEGVAQNFFLKNIDSNDNRRRVYQLGVQYEEEIITWVNRQKLIFCADHN